MKSTRRKKVKPPVGAIKQPTTAHYRSTVVVVLNIVSSLQAYAQQYEHILHASGGALKLPKCFWYAITWDWAQGFPIIRSKNKFHSLVRLTNHDNNSNSDIRMNGPSDAKQTLGVRLAPSGAQLTELKSVSYTHLTLPTILRV